MTIAMAIACWTLLFLPATSCAFAQGTGPQNVQKSCRDFAQGFYDRYVPKALKESEVPAPDLALRYKTHALSSELLRQLREDSASQAKAVGEIVGLDFDPFLNSQDPGERYVTGKVTTKGDRCWVEVYGI
jgi:hypothetical protein